MKNTTSKEVVTEAIVLRAETFGENDILVDFLTREGGRLRGIARHGRKSRRRFGTVLDALNLLTIRYKELDVFVSLEEASLVPGVRDTLRTLPHLATGFFIVDLVRSFILERHRDVALYRLVREFLLRIYRSTTLKRDLFLFEESFLKQIGYELSLRCCSVCATPWETTSAYFFSYARGFLYCPSCRPSEGLIESVEKKELPFFLARFFEYQLGHSLKSFKLLTAVLRSD